MKSAVVASFAPVAALAALTSCASLEPGDELAASTSHAAFTRAVAAPPAQVTDAATDVLRALGLPLEYATGEGLVVSGTVTVHEEWQRRPVPARLLCGVPVLQMGDRDPGGWIPYTGHDDDKYERAVAYTAGVPIDVRMGFRAEPTVDGSSVTLLMTATARTESASPLGPREVACLPTREFVDELFAGLEARVHGAGTATEPE